jgi:hypothetical protein
MRALIFSRMSKITFVLLYWIEEYGLASVCQIVRGVLICVAVKSARAKKTASRDASCEKPQKSGKRALDAGAPVRTSGQAK